MCNGFTRRDFLRNSLIGGLLWKMGSGIRGKGFAGKGGGEDVQ